MDGFQTHVIIDGWGEANVFVGNSATVQGPGHGIKVTGKGTRNIVDCDNTASAAGGGVTNVACVPDAG